MFIAGAVQTARESWLLPTASLSNISQSRKPSLKCITTTMTGSFVRSSNVTSSRFQACYKTIHSLRTIVPRLQPPDEWSSRRSMIIFCATVPKLTAAARLGDGFDVPSDMFSRSCQMCLNRSWRYSQNPCCLKDREPPQDAELKCSSQSRRQACCTFVQACLKLQIAAFLFGAGARIGEILPKEVILFVSCRLIQRQMNLPGTLAQLHQSTVAHNCGHPSRHLCLSSELADMPVGG